MPRSTPVYGFTYPCAGEIVDEAAMALLAGQIDTKVNDVRLDMIAALQRRNVDDTSGATTQTITAGVDTVLTLTPGSTYTTPVAGVYVVSATVRATNLPAVNMMRTRVRQNGVVRFGFTQNTEGNIPMATQATGPIVAAAGDTITVQFLYSGAATMTVTCEIDVKLLCRIA